MAAELVYGLHDLATVRNRLISEIGITEMSSRIEEWRAERNRVFDAIMNTFTVRNESWNTTPITRMKVPSAAKMQFVDEFGVSKPQILRGYQEQGLPLWRYEASIGFTFEALQRITVQDYSDDLARIESADMKAAEDLFWFAVFYDNNWTFKSTEENLPDVPVKALANGDTDVYMLRGGTIPETANHYVGQAAAISDSADPFPGIVELLTAPVGTTANDRIVTFVGDSTLVSDIIDLSGFTRRESSKFTSWGADVSFVNPSADAFIGMGERVIGEHEDGVLVIRKRDLPANYMVSFNLDAPAPIGIREDPAIGLRGLFNINAIEDSGGTLLSRFRRKIGFAPINRTSIVVHEIGDSTYDPPTAYENLPG